MKQKRIPQLPNGKFIPEYYVWQQMKARCLNKNHKYFKNYGGRGITVCDRWMDFMDFYKDMGKRPANTSIDRIDNNRGYYPDNCRWADQKTQCRNKRSNRIVSIHGEQLVFITALEKYELVAHKSVIAKRLQEGWEAHVAFFTSFERKPR